MFILFPVLPVCVSITDQKLNYEGLSPIEDAEYITNASFAARRAQINFLFLRDNAGLRAAELILKFKIDNAVTIIYSIICIIGSVDILIALFMFSQNVKYFEY